MKIFLSLLATLLVLAGVSLSAVGAQNSFAAFRGAYSGTCTAEIISSVSGSVTVAISPLAKKRHDASIVITGTLSPSGATPGAGNATPMKGRISFRQRRVVADSFLLGLGAKRAAARITRLHGGGAAYRFTLESAEGDGWVRYVLKLKKGILTISGTGLFHAANSDSQPVHIEITAQKS